MRRRTALLTTLPLFLVTAGALAIACGGDDSGGVHGAVFGNDGGNQGDGTTILGDGSLPPTDAGKDGSTILPDGGGCVTGTVAVIGGGASGSFEANAFGSGPFASVTFTPGMVAIPAIVSIGGGFQVVFHGTASDQLEALSLSAAGAWSAATGISGAVGHEEPALAISGATLHLLYQSSDDKYYHSTLVGSTWAASDPMGIAADQSFGPHPPAGAGDPTTLVAGQVGSDDNIYMRTFTSSWAAAAAIEDGGADKLGSSDATIGSRPRMISMSGGTADMLLVYSHNGDQELLSVARTSGTWASGPTQVHAATFTNEAIQLAALAGGKAILAFRGTDQHGYVSIYDGTNWSAPFAVAPFAIGSAPGVAIGNCGSVAVAAYAKVGGDVEMVRYDGSAWSTSTSVVTKLGTPSFVAIAVTP